MGETPRSEEELLARVYSRSAEIRRRRAAARTGAGLLAVVLVATFGLTQLLGGTGPGAPGNRGPGQIARGPTTPPPGPEETPPAQTPRDGRGNGSDRNGNGNGNNSGNEPPGGPGPIARDQVLSLPVSFSVANTNRSLIPCPTDGRDYTIRGLLIGPPDAMSRARRSVTLYIHATGTGLWQWHFKPVPGYDYATEMALRGHTSIIIDRLGFDSSDHPNGFDTCVGGEADMIDQMGRALRAGSYRLAGRPGPSFERIGLAGHSLGSIIVESALRSFGGFDALMIVSWGDIFTPLAVRTIGIEVMPNVARVCAQGGQPAEPGTPSGYVNVWEHAERTFGVLAYNMDPAVLREGLPLTNLEPCGSLGSGGGALAINSTLISTITAPVLLIQGSNDPLVTPEGARLHTERFVSSSDVTLSFVDEAGHAPMLERRASEFRLIASHWLAAHGF